MKNYIRHPAGLSPFLLLICESSHMQYSALMQLWGRQQSTQR